MRDHHAARAAACFGLNSGSSSSHNLIQFLKNALHIADDGDIRDAVLADFGGIDIYMNDAGVAGKSLELAGDAIVETCAEGDEKVALGHAHVGGVTAVHARHADEVWWLEDRLPRAMRVQTAGRSASSTSSVSSSEALPRTVPPPA